MSKGNVRWIIADPRFSLEFQKFVVQHLVLLMKMQTEMLQQLTEMNRQIKEPKGGNMTEDDTNNRDGQSANEPPFEEFLRSQFELLFARLDNIENKLLVDLRVEMVERFLQLSRQIKHLDQKVDIFVQEHTFLKDELRELRGSQRVKN
jgi:hypothetical protein